MGMDISQHARAAGGARLAFFMRRCSCVQRTPRDFGRIQSAEIRHLLYSYCSRFDPILTHGRT
jgi:hypothetical protein